MLPTVVSVPSFSFIGDFNDPNRELDVRVQSATNGGYWIFMRRL